MFDLKRHWRTWVGLLVSLAFLVVLSRQVTDLGRSVQAVQEANYWWLPPALVVYFIGVWIRAVRWRFLLGPVKTISVGRLFPVVVIGYMTNDILPMRIGELVRAHILGERENISKSATFATIIVERIFDGVTMVLFIGVILLFHLVPGNADLENLFRITGILFAGALIAFFVVALSPGVVNRLLDLILSAMPPSLAERASPFLRRFFTGLQVLQSPRSVLITLGLSILAWLCEASMYYILLFAFQGLAPLLLLPQSIILTTAVANLGALVPSSPGYIGPFDFFAVLALGLYNVERGLALAYTAVVHIALIVPITLWGFYYWVRYHLSLKEIRGEAVIAGEEKS
jgi:glycosyltransferase 2 family protein